ncbi:hypothetical protein [Saliphagus infecundisoli]|uniref:Uncharacterized protein n=1 Tax=Saliphagus infecundisoli TaxID=1849069 RepID=A0ABD5QBR0_9EURY|nr:hypothetical protein [Saliphagus infecundisoli]
MSISSKLRQELDNLASDTEINNLTSGDADLHIVHNPNDIDYYHIEGGSIYKASMELELDNNTSQMAFIFPVDTSSEGELISDLNNANQAEITYKMGDWSSLLP